VNHIAFKCDNAQQTYDELLAKGVKTMRAPNYVNATGRTTVNLRDPDGWRCSWSTRIARHRSRRCNAPAQAAFVSG